MWLGGNDNYLQTLPFLSWVWVSATNMSSIQVAGARWAPSLLLASLEGPQVSTLSGRGPREPDFSGQLGSEFVEPGIFLVFGLRRNGNKGQSWKLDRNLFGWRKIWLAKVLNYDWFCGQCFDVMFFCHLSFRNVSLGISWMVQRTLSLGNGIVKPSQSKGRIVVFEDMD